MLNAGDKLPAFALPSDDGRTISSRDFAKKTVVVYFYPKDSTPGCTREGQAFSKLLPAFRKAGAEVLGVSKDSLQSHANFRTKYTLSVPLLSDPDLAVHKAFGAYGEKVMYGKKVTGVLRSTFVFRDGIATKVYPRVKVDGHAEAVLAFLSGAAPAKAPKGPKKAAAPKKAAPKKAAPKKAAPKKGARTR